MNPYQVTSNEVYAWLETGPSPEDVDAVLAALPLIAKAPYAPPAMPVPGQRAPVYTWPVPGTYLAITYLVAEQFHAVRVIRIAQPDH